MLSRRRWLIALAAALAVFQAGAAWGALRVPGDLAGQVSLPPPLAFAGGVIWALAWGLVALALLRRHPRAGLFTAWVMVGFVLYSLGRLVIFAQADYDRQRLPFLIAGAAVILIIPTLHIVRSARIRSTESSEHGRKLET